MLHEYQKKSLQKEVESFKDELDFVKTILKDDDEIRLFMVCRAIKSIDLGLPNVLQVTTVDDGLSSIPDHLKELIRVLKDR